MALAGTTCVGHTGMHCMHINNETSLLKSYLNTVIQPSWGKWNGCKDGMMKIKMSRSPALRRQRPVDL